MIFNQSKRFSDSTVSKKCLTAVVAAVYFMNEISFVKILTMKQQGAFEDLAKHGKESSLN